MATLYQKLRLLQGVWDGERAFVGPFHAMLDVTGRCNLRCAGCRFHSLPGQRPASGGLASPDIPFDMAVQLCRDLEALHTRALFILGSGEPLLYPRIFELLSTAKAFGLHVTLITNGTLLDEEAVEGVLQSGLDDLQVSLWAATPEVYEKQYPGTDPRSFTRVLDGLKLLAARKTERKAGVPRIILHQPINRNNFRELELLVDLARETGCDGISFSPYLSWHGQFSSAALTAEEQEGVCRTLKSIARRLRGSALSHNIGRVLLRYSVGPMRGWKIPCYAGWSHSRIRVDGTVQPCGPCDLTMGNLKDKSFRAIWNDEPYRAFRRSTMSRNMPDLLTRTCDCEFCCYIEDSSRIHRFFRWLRPWAIRRREKSCPPN